MKPYLFDGIYQYAFIKSAIDEAKQHIDSNIPVLFQKSLDSIGKMAMPYGTPLCEVIELNGRLVICQSGSNQRYENNSDLDWFEE